MRLGTILLFLAAALIVHAGFSTEHYQTAVLPFLSDGAPKVPLDVYVELALAFALALFGALSRVKFSPIFSAGETSMNAFYKLFGPRTDFAPLPAAKTD